MSDIDIRPKTSSNILFTKNMKISNEQYTLSSKIGCGNFGEVYLGVNNSAKNHKNLKMVAVKIQKQTPGRVAQLPNEVSILKTLKSDKLSLGFPELYDHGNEKNSYFMITELLGPNLNDLMKMCGGKFSLITTLYLAMQIFQRIEFLHAKGYVYRDIKPQNFLMGLGQRSSILYLIDFGLSKQYRDPRINLHKPYKQQRDFSGTLRYASICSHLKIEHNRRDDLQSVCYMLIYFLLGTLPWQKNKTENSESKQRLILDKKMKISTVQLCKDVPLEFRLILEYCLELEYYEEPDYEIIQGHLMDLYEKISPNKNFQYDWALLPKQKSLHKDELTIKLQPPDQIRNIYIDDSLQKTVKQKQGKEVCWLDQKKQQYEQQQGSISLNEQH